MLLEKNQFKTDYIVELMITGYTQEEAEEQYKLELEAIKHFDFEYYEEDED